MKPAPTIALALSAALATLFLATLARAGEGSEACRRCKLDAWLDHADPSAFDASTGRDVRNFPPDRVVDCLHMRLEITIEDMDTPRAQCVQRLTVTPIGSAVSQFALDARLFAIQSVEAPGHTVTHTHDGLTLRLTFDPPLAVGESRDIITTYEVRDPRRGIIWTPASPANPDRPPQLHTQGQPQTNSHWFPCRDFPNERLTTEIIATVPAGFVACSNGRLIDRTKTVRTVAGVGNAKQLRPYETFHWLQDKPHVNYLVSLVVGKFDIVDVGDRKLPMPVYAPPGRGQDVPATFGRTLAMVRFFEQRLDEPYPWDQYAQLVALNFEAGGMENTGATTLHENAVLFPGTQEEFDLDGLIAHELGHQWFGDLLTCNSWEHIWLNEGFATYMDALWFEERDGAEAYEREMFANIDQVLREDTGTFPEALAMASKVYEDPWQTFRKPANPYPKGASVLHMLRRMMGDEVFFRGVAAYIDKHKFGTVETDQFRRVMEDVSGLELEQFFAQWVYRPGTPTLKITPKYDPTRRKLRLTIEQTQPIDADNPAFALTLPIYIKNSAGPDVITDYPLRKQREVFEVDLEGEPVFVAPDPRQTILARFDVEQTDAMRVALVRSGPSTSSRVHALRAIANESVGQAEIDLLRTLAADRNTPILLRLECLTKLGAVGKPTELRTLATSLRDNWEIREALVRALAASVEAQGSNDDANLRAQAGDFFAQRLTTDPSLKVRAAAIKSLATIRDERALEAIREASITPSQSDTLRHAAIDAIKELKPASGLQILERLSREGVDGRTRAAAIEAIPAVAGEDKSAALNMLTSLLASRENRPRMAAASALTELGDERGLGPLQAAAENERAPELARRLRDQSEKLAKKLRGTAPNAN